MSALSQFLRNEITLEDYRSAIKADLDTNSSLAENPVYFQPFVGDNR